VDLHDTGMVLMGCLLALLSLTHLTLALFVFSLYHFFLLGSVLLSSMTLHDFSFPVLALLELLLRHALLVTLWPYSRLLLESLRDSRERVLWTLWCALNARWRGP
jgi:hypothetical protein